MQQEFEGILVLKADDFVASDDPMEAFLQMKGWKLNRVRELKRSIEDKQIPPLFGDAEPMTASEKELLKDMGEYMTKQLERSCV